LHLAIFENQKSQTKSGFFSVRKAGSGKTLFELHIHYKSLLTRVDGHVGCKEYCRLYHCPKNVRLYLRSKCMTM